MLSRCVSEMQDLVSSCREHCWEMALAAGPSLRAASAEENKVKVKLLSRASLCPAPPVRGRDGPGSCPNLDQLWAVLMSCPGLLAASQAPRLPPSPAPFPSLCCWRSHCSCERLGLGYMFAVRNQPPGQGKKIQTQGRG